MKVSDTVEISIPLPKGEVTKKEVIDSVASRLGEELKNYPDRISMSSRSVHYEGRRRGEAVYRVSYQ